MYIWWDRTVSFFDIWSIEHFIYGITIGSIIILILNKFKIQSRNEYQAIYYLTILVITFLWKIIEHYLESGITNQAVNYWFQGIESWGNRILTAPLLAMIGAYINLKYIFFKRYAQYFSISWLALHIAIFPYSMYLQNIIS
jgi:hypothetical protein